MNGQAGKGDRYRPVDPKKWAKGWARAFGKKNPPKRYTLCDGLRLAKSDTPVYWWCPNATDPNRVKVLSVLPPPPVDAEKPVRWRNWVGTYNGTIGKG